MPSFDIVSEVDKHQLTNAVDQVNRTVANRFDFKGVDAQVEMNGFDLTVRAEADIQVTQMVDMLRAALIKCSIDPLAMTVGEPEQSGKQIKVAVTLKNGLEKELSKKIVKLIKDEKLKVQASIQGEQVRVTGKKRDDLQQVIAMLKGKELDQPLQFTNFRD
ncbi:YajQ family cyclic di-GMP-binding protein [Microbulbifer thermotolerans]|uniref:Nucleotide-binding protein A3224_06350 n=1 Tax=Microbulbifer thermotolerans TaxID=252514 RepID=A0A143HKK2_MICTH|nr:YajQ family cyclic di-GMP-binding protein [Microbulbifer thermotolerans]AMX02254.1 YajQ family cyclic di-GMP-binding protein [Microbulbifer thermotolerans]MCX2778764.1 YajQ family cyclic di-GMP-binding protein [Microbulbifer thermotolerans]MCX2781964.1 YajQ family cyclic di-GMP-binding protein [Microbulbifer thermotolerans]MCX2793650.1 YajQ family cyclic di-GMP-binding protein [Microbulbifer thermotolerans]MCX2804069.1 YajQ family cyclic di-GMP-binding protein [Microbulbifer thermotolerans]